MTQMTPKDDTFLLDKPPFGHLLGLKSVTIHSITHVHNMTKPKLISQKHEGLLVLAITE